MPDRLTRVATALVACSVAGIGLAACSSAPAAKPAPASTTTPSPSATATAAAGPTCPLTGEPVEPAAAAKRPAVAVKIDNIAEARPQAGLNAADVVVQEQVEGGLTRLFAVFSCHVAPNVGPIRSARTTDADLLALLGGSVFAYSGANPKVMPPIESVGKAVLISWDATPAEFRVDPARPAPHDIFGSTASLLKTGEARHSGRIPAPRAWFSYGRIDRHSRRVREVSMSWPAASASWRWSGKRWLRTQDGTPDLLTGGQQVSATNLVVLGVQLQDTGIRDVAGNPSPDDLVVGSGPAWVLRGGWIIRGTWSRPSVDDRWRLRDNRGATIRLAPGRTWVELLSDPGSLRTR